jgi:hypothetical protein
MMGTRTVRSIVDTLTTRYGGLTSAEALAAVQQMLRERGYVEVELDDAVLAPDEQRVLRAAAEHYEQP